MIFTQGATRLGYAQADQTVPFAGRKNGTTRMRSRMRSDIITSAGMLAHASDLLDQLNGGGRHDAPRTI